MWTRSCSGTEYRLRMFPELRHSDLVSMASKSSPNAFFCLVPGCCRSFDNEAAYEAHLPACREMGRSPWQVPPRIPHIDPDLPRPLTTIGYIRNTQLNLLICRLCSVAISASQRFSHPKQAHGLKPLCDVNKFIERHRINVISEYDPSLQFYTNYRQIPFLRPIAGIAIKIGYRCKICWLCLRHPISLTAHIRHTHYAEHPERWMVRVAVQTIFEGIASKPRRRARPRPRPRPRSSPRDVIWMPAETFSSRLWSSARQRYRNSQAREAAARRCSAPDMHGVPALGLPDIELEHLMSNLNINKQHPSK